MRPLRVPIRTVRRPLRARRTAPNADLSDVPIVRTPVRNARRTRHQARQQMVSRLKGASAADVIADATATAIAVATSSEIAKLLREHLRPRAKVLSRNAPDLPDRPSRSAAISQSRKRKSVLHAGPS